MTAPGVRPMTTADYAAGGRPITGQLAGAARTADPASGAKLGEILLGAVLTAAAFWLVPKVLDMAVERAAYHDDFDDEDTELQVTG